MRLTGKKLKNTKNSYAYDLVRLLCLRTAYTSESKLVIDLVETLAKLPLSTLSNLNMLVKFNIKDNK